MKYIICEQRPAHYDVQVAPLPVPTINLERAELDNPQAVLARLQACGIGGALTQDQVISLEYPSGDYELRYRYSPEHHDQPWLRLCTPDRLGMAMAGI